MKTYTVKPGQRFLLPDTGEGVQVVEGGGTILLDNAEAERFADRIIAKRGKAAKPTVEAVEPAKDASKKAE